MQYLIHYRFAAALGILAAVALLCVVPANAAPTSILTVTQAKAKIRAFDDSPLEIFNCRRLAPRHIRCQTMSYIGVTREVIDQATGEVISSETDERAVPVPLVADVGLRGVTWALPGFAG